jgi:hypothetical protein
LAAFEMSMDLDEKIREETKDDIPKALSEDEKIEVEKQTLKEIEEGINSFQIGKYGENCPKEIQSDLVERFRSLVNFCMHVVAFLRSKGK